MKVSRIKQSWIMGFGILLMICLLIFMTVTVRQLQSNARVINYSGIVRGATQRLVKNELQGIPDDSEIMRLDDILRGLKTGKSSYDISLLEDKAFQDKLAELSVEWDLLKSQIVALRDNPSQDATLYDTSERYFFMADEAVSLAEKNSYNLAQKLKFLQAIIFIDLVLIVLSLLSQIASEIKTNRKLNKIAYIDPNTGLPNKRSCEEKLSEGAILSDDNNVCCFMFDLNNLKLVNDSMGHKAGDTLISSFSRILRRSAPPHMFVGRIGGDEFIGIMEGTDTDEINTFIRNLKLEAEGLNWNESEHSLSISFAYGYAFSPDYPNHSINALMDVADKNMYNHKMLVKKQKNIPL